MSDLFLHSEIVQTKKQPSAGGSRWRVVGEMHPRDRWLSCACVCSVLLNNTWVQRPLVIKRILHTFSISKRWYQVKVGRSFEQACILSTLQEVPLPPFSVNEYNPWEYIQYLAMSVKWISIGTAVEAFLTDPRKRTALFTTAFTKPRFNTNSFFFLFLFSLPKSFHTVVFFRTPNVYC